MADRCCARVLLYRPGSNAAGRAGIATRDESVLGTPTTGSMARASREADAGVDTAERIMPAWEATIRPARLGKAFCIPAGRYSRTVANANQRLIYDEYSSFTPDIQRMQQRAAIDRSFSCAKRAASVVIRPPYLWRGACGKESAQVAGADTMPKSGLVTYWQAKLLGQLALEMSPRSICSRCRSAAVAYYVRTARRP